MPVHTYTNWNQRPSDHEEQIEPFRKYFFICEGANTETFYFKHLIDLRKELGYSSSDRYQIVGKMAGSGFQDTGMIMIRMRPEEWTKSRTI